MAKKAKPVSNLVSLAAIIAATASAGFLYATPESVKAHIDNGDAELNTAVVNPDNANEFAVRATEKGKASVSDQSNAAPANDAPKSPATTFEIFITPKVEARKRGGGGRGDKYPFDALSAPDGAGNLASFFVPLTTEFPEPWKSLSSTVSSASRRYATETGTEEFTRQGVTKTRPTYSYSRKFSVAEYDRKNNDGSVTKGALVQRTL